MRLVGSPGSPELEEAVIKAEGKETAKEIKKDGESLHGASPPLVSAAVARA
jgi:hypothetical protein